MRQQQLEFINLPSSFGTKNNSSNSNSPKNLTILSLEDADKKYSKRMESILKETFHHEQFRGLQRNIIINCLSGRDVFGLMPTGAGKSLCFQLPALIYDGVTVVTSPLIALMQNQVQALQSKGIKVGILNSSLPKSERDKVYFDLRSKSISIKLLYVTPELLCMDFFLSVLDGLYQKGMLSLFAIDEAHCISSWGHDFRPAFRNLSVLKQKFPAVPIMALTATATQKVQDDIIHTLNLKIGKENMFKTSFDRSNISYSVRYKEIIEDSVKDLKKFLIEKKLTNSCGVIYCLQRASCDELAEDLRREGFSAKAYHASLSASDRKTILEEWSSDKTKIVCATIAFGMGIDKPDVRFVVHFTISKSLEAFYQESGRAGRDGKASFSVIYYSRKDKSMLEYLLSKTEEETEKTEKKSKNEKKYREKRESNENAQLGFQKVVHYCIDFKCRRKSLLSYFGETNVRCGNCDVCNEPKQTEKDLNLALATLNAPVKFSGTLGKFDLDDTGFLLPYEDECDDEEEEVTFVDLTKEEKEATREAMQVKASLPKNASKSQILDALEKAEAIYDKKNNNNFNSKKRLFDSISTTSTSFTANSSKFNSSSLHSNRLNSTSSNQTSSAPSSFITAKSFLTNNNKKPRFF